MLLVTSSLSQLRSQVPSEMLREHRPALYTRSLAEKAARRPPEIEDDSRWGRFVSRAKGVASKGKAAISAKYVSGRSKGQDDIVELLPTTNHDEPRRSSALNSARCEPPKRLFDDV